MTTGWGTICLLQSCKCHFLFKRRKVINKHISLNITGLVQGIGFRPFVFRLASQYQQKGWMANSTEGVTIELEGLADKQALFIEALQSRPPPFTDIKSLIIKQLPGADFKAFALKPSMISSEHSAFVLPDLSSCSECVTDLFNPDSRFYRYPFTSCSQCGPRYSIMQAQPYDRKQTAMADFELCPVCLQDYTNPDNRRFHAQTIACPTCGPQLSLLDNRGNLINEKRQALATALKLLRKGKIIAVKGIGGFQLLTDARNQKSVTLLRQRKNRAKKPFALMLPDLETAQLFCYINDNEQQAITSSAAPIVLLKRRPNSVIGQAVAPDNALLGIMLPYSALHHLLMHDFSAPLVATSGNRHSEPICIDEQQVVERLHDVVDAVLTHNRPILRPLDDSIVRFIGSKITVLRRARGYTPYPVTVNKPLPASLAVGGHLKNTIAINQGNQLILSQHLGDLDTVISQQQFQKSMGDIQRFFQHRPEQVIHDAHPDYSSTQYARQLKLPKLSVQHHFAHVLSCMAEHDLAPPLLGISWDGSGLGIDHHLWGGEFFILSENSSEHFARFRTFPLPGNHKAIQEPRRSALGLLYELSGSNPAEIDSYLAENTFSKQEFSFLISALNKDINCPHTSSVGRLFDAVSSLLHLCQINSYEGEGAVYLESAADKSISEQSYPFVIHEQTPLSIDWQPVIESILKELSESNHPLIALKFHNTLAEIILSIAQLSDQSNIVLSGGCFQNACLVDRIIKRVGAAGFNIYQHEVIPPNDGGLALGQLLARHYIDSDFVTQTPFPENE